MESYAYCIIAAKSSYPDNKVYGATMGPIWGRQDPGGPHVGAMIFAIWVSTGNGLLPNCRQAII